MTFLFLWLLHSEGICVEENNSAEKCRQNFREEHTKYRSLGNNQLIQHIKAIANTDPYCVNMLAEGFAYPISEQGPGTQILREDALGAIKTARDKLKDQWKINPEERKKYPAHGAAIDSVVMPDSLKEKVFKYTDNNILNHPDMEMNKGEQKISLNQQGIAWIMSRIKNDPLTHTQLSCLREIIFDDNISAPEIQNILPYLNQITKITLNFNTQNLENIFQFLPKTLSSITVTSKNQYEENAFVQKLTEFLNSDQNTLLKNIQFIASHGFTQTLSKGE